MAENKKYYQLLNDPRWIRKSQQIRNRDDNRCRACNETGHVEVHHVIYRKGLLPWEYDDKELVTLCNVCHKQVSESINESIELVRRISCDPDAAEQLTFLLEQLLGINPWRIRKYAKRMEHNNRENDLIQPDKNLIHG